MGATQSHTNSANYGTVAQRPMGFGAKATGLTKKLRKEAKCLGIRVTRNLNGKRVYKSNAMLAKQIAKKVKKAKKSGRPAKTGKKRGRPAKKDKKRGRPAKKGLKKKVKTKTANKCTLNRKKSACKSDPDCQWRKRGNPRCHMAKGRKQTIPRAPTAMPTYKAYRPSTAFGARPLGFGARPLGRPLGFGARPLGFGARPLALRNRV